jgi:actin-like ATPase involved in cell morphogenesis
MIVAIRMFQKQFSAINLLSNSYPLSKGYHKDSHLVTFDQQIADHYPLAIEIREALSECVATILNAIRVALERTPPEPSADISDRGIVLTGGGALIKNLDRRIREETGLPVPIAEDPLASVVLGTGRMLTDFKLLRRIAVE